MPAFDRRAHRMEGKGMTVEEQNRERRDREIERSGHLKMVSPFFAKVVGVSFVPAYPDNLLALEQASVDANQSGEALAVILVRNPNNAYDGNAIEVHIPALGEDWAMIGHLERPIAARMAPDIDAGQVWAAQIETVLINPEHLDRPGISIECARMGSEEES